MQLLSHRTLSQPLSTSSVLRNENVSDEPMRRNNDFRPRNQPSTTLYVGNIPYNAEVSEIRELFAPYGPIQDVRMGYRPDGTASGYAHIQFEKLDDSIAAYTSGAEEPLYIMGRNLRLDYAGQKSKHIEPNHKLYFFGFKGDEAELRKATREFESGIIGYYMLTDLATRKQSGTGFIEFTSVDRATEALERLDGTILSDGNKFSLNYARARQPRDNSGNQRGRRAGYAGDWGGGRRSQEFQQDRRGGPGQKALD